MIRLDLTLCLKINIPVETIYQKVSNRRLSNETKEMTDYYLFLVTTMSSTKKDA